MKLTAQPLSLIYLAIYTFACDEPLSRAAELAEFDELRINQMQVIGSHNSFKAASDPEWFKLMVATVPKANEMDYAHPPLNDQLNLGLRNLELDLFHDPEGGRYAQPLGIKMTRLAGREPLPYDPLGKMSQPGFKVLHVQDIDFRSNVLTLTDALAEIRRWSAQHPQHLPVMITFNLNDQPIELPGAVRPLPFDAGALDALDEALIAGLGQDNLITPDDVRNESKTLSESVREDGWPTLAEACGRCLLVLDDMGAIRENYLTRDANLQGRAMFVNSRPEEAAAAVMIRNNPIEQTDEITKLVQQGFLVRTRADAATREARAGDYTRFEAAKRSGAHVISTDFYLADRRLHPTFRIRFEDQRCVRLNPITSDQLSEEKGRHAK